MQRGREKRTRRKKGGRTKGKDVISIGKKEEARDEENRRQRKN
jgi:hypothetical protein